MNAGGIMKLNLDETKLLNVIQNIFGITSKEVLDSAPDEVFLEPKNVDGNNVSLYDYISTTLSNTSYKEKLSYISNRIQNGFKIDKSLEGEAIDLICHDFLLKQACLSI